MDISSETIDNITVIRVAGDVDLYSAPILGETLNPMIDSGKKKFLLDLTECDSIDSMGVGACIILMKKLGKTGKIHIANANANVERSFQLAKLKPLFGFYTSTDEGIKTLNS